MAIDDDPIDIVQKNAKADENQRSPVTNFIVQALTEHVPYGELVTRFIDRDREANRELLIQTLGKQLKALGARLDRADEEYQRFLRDDFARLVMDALRKAENLRSTARIQRLATILANAAGVGPAQSPDDTEELMRVAMEISDVEIDFLQRLDKTGRFSDETRGLATIDEANEEWKTYRPKIDGYDRSDGQSMGAKLQSFGLVEGVERRPNISGVEDTPFRMLRKGHVFLRFIKEQSG